MTPLDDATYKPLGDRFGSLYTGAVADVLDEMGIRGQALPHGIAPLRPGMRLAGPAYAVEGRAHPDMDHHASMTSILSMLGAVPDHHVVVYQPHDDSCSHLGELSVVALKARGCVGAVLDGGCRDIGHILGEEVPVFCRYTSPIDAVGRWEVIRHGHEVFFGSIRVQTGDYVLADDDGVVVVPREVCDEVLVAAESVAGAEDLVRDAVRRGVAPLDAYAEHGRF